MKADSSGCKWQGYCCSRRHCEFIDQSVLTSNFSLTNLVEWLWVETEDLTIVRSWKEVQSGWVGISDHNLAMTTCFWVYDCQPEVEVRSVDGNWKTVARVARHNKPRPQFVNDDLVSVLGTPTNLIRTDGQIVFAEEKPAEGCWWGQAVPSCGGRRFVVPSCKLKVRVAALDLRRYDLLQQLVVYDAPFHGKSHIRY